jgi:hypothetical protein
MRKIMACSVLTVLFCVSLGSADLVKSRKGEIDLVLPAQMTRSYMDTFRKDERALAIASGNGRACLGLYVFDSQGNCLAKDDLSAPATADDLIVEWYPAEQGRYSVDVRNAGFETNKYQIALR